MRLNYVFVFMCLAVSLFAKPMESARGTLFILLDGMAPKNHGLYEKYCVDFNYEFSGSWEKRGLRSTFRKK